MGVKNCRIILQLILAVVPCLLIEACNQKSSIQAALGNSSNASSSTSVAPTPPPQAAALGFKTLVLNQGGAAGWNIDVNNTGLPGYVWYQEGFDGIPKVHSNNFSVSAGVLTVTNAGTGNNFNWTLSSAEHSTNTQGYVGTAYGGGYYAEASISVVPNSVTASDDKTGGWPAFWGEPLEHLAKPGIVDQWPGQISGFEHFVELDFMEFWGSKYTFANLDWYGKYGTPTANCKSLCYVGNNGNTSGVPDYAVTTVPTGINWNNFNTYGALVVPSNLNGGIGYTQAYFNDVKSAGQNTWSKYNPNATPPPSGNQVFSMIDNDHYVIILGTGPDSPMKVNFVRIWQK